MKKFVLFILTVLMLTSCSTARRVRAVETPSQAITEYHMTPEMQNLSINGVVYVITLNRLVDSKTGITTVKTQYRQIYDLYCDRVLDEMVIRPVTIL